jgi:hypothetical protein
MKIVLNGCYGGFNLSHLATYLYVIAKEQTPYFYVDVSTYDANYKKEPVYKLISLSEAQISHLYVYCTPRYQGKILHGHLKDIINVRDIDRTDPVLVSVVETIGPEAASGRFASLEIHEIPDGTLYQIDSYDGLESLITQDDDDWLVAHDREQPNKQLLENIWATIKPLYMQTNDDDLTFKIQGEQ